MAIKVLQGIESLKIGACGAAGTMGTTLTSIGKLVDDSIQLIFDEPQKTNITTEDTTAPIVTLVDPSVARRLEFETYDFDPDLLATLFGGTEAAGKWSAATDYDPIEQSVEVITKTIDGYYAKIEIPRANLVASMTAKIGKKGLGQLKVVLEVLMPYNGSSVAQSPIQISSIAAV